MTPRRQLSIAIRKAADTAEAYRAAQAELHDAFQDVYGFNLDIEELSDYADGGCPEWVDPLVYGQGQRPSLEDFDKAVKNKQQSEEDNEV